MGVQHRIQGRLMRALAPSIARLYGDRLFHLIVVVAAFALGGYAISVLGVRNLFNPEVWWQSIGVWFAVAVIGHDLILFPLYALADRLLTIMSRNRPARGKRSILPSARVPVLNYLRVPTLAAGLLLVMFLPGIIQQGAPIYRAATGLTQAPYLSRWLLLTAVFYLLSAMCYALKTLNTNRVSPPTRACPPRPENITRALASGAGAETTRGRAPPLP
jgi:hypothetical protein